MLSDLFFTAESDSVYCAVQSEPLGIIQDSRIL